MKCPASPGPGNAARCKSAAGTCFTLLFAAVLLWHSASAWAEDSRERRRDESVVACSDYGRGCVRGPVRRGRVEREVRMPGGTWIGCKGNCRRTLREEALDFFETLNDRVWDD